MEFLTVKEAARELKTSVSTVRTLIDTGRLEAIDIGSGKMRRNYRIRRDSIENLGETKRAPRISNPQKLGRIHPALKDCI